MLEDVKVEGKKIRAKFMKMEKGNWCHNPSLGLTTKAKVCKGAS
jgi:hypothetical protein